MECNAIITGLNENQNENLPLLVQNVFTQDHEMQESEVNNVGIIKLYRQRDPKTNRKIPRPVFIQFNTKKKQSRIPKLKEKKSPVRISNQFPEEMRERRKRLYDLQHSYNERQITTVIKGDKLVFPSNGSVYREKVNRPSADELLDASSDKIETKVFEGKHTDDKGNRFSSYAAEVGSVKKVNQALKKILRLPRVSSTTHNLYAYIFTNSEGVTHEGSDDDGEHGGGRALLREMKDNTIKN